jgi:hypothetical protein
MESSFDWLENQLDTTTIAKELLGQIGKGSSS